MKNTTDVRIAGLHGRSILPGDPDYDQARAVFFGGIDHHPDVIVRAADATDVARVVTFARERGLDLAVRSGGHSPVGLSVSQGGITLDLRDLDLDVAGRTAWVGPGLTSGEMVTATSEHGLGVGFGDTGSVGIGGITTGGGIGYLVRKHGLTIDALLAADIVTADGAAHRVDAEQEPDLFWAIRGGGASVGVVTRLHFRFARRQRDGRGPACPSRHRRHDRVISRAGRGRTGGALDHRERDARAAAALPRGRAPRHARDLRDARVQRRRGGRSSRGRAVPRHRGAAGRPAGADVLSRGLPTRGSQLPPDRLGTDDLRRPDRSPVRPDDRRDAHRANAGVRRVTDPRARWRDGPRPRGCHGLRAPRPARDDQRGDALRASGGGADARGLVERFAADLRRGPDGAYVGLLAADGPRRIRAAYPGTTWDRLVAIKRRYDPGNLFHLNQNIPPAR